MFNTWLNNDWDCNRVPRQNDVQKVVNIRKRDVIFLQDRQWGRSDTKNRYHIIEYSENRLISFFFLSPPGGGCLPCLYFRGPSYDNKNGSSQNIG